MKRYMILTEEEGEVWLELLLPLLPQKQERPSCMASGSPERLSLWHHFSGAGKSD